MRAEGNLCAACQPNKAAPHRLFLPLHLWVPPISLFLLSPSTYSNSLDKAASSLKCISFLPSCWQIWKDREDKMQKHVSSCAEETHTPAQQCSVWTNMLSELLCNSVKPPPQYPDQIFTDCSINAFLCVRSAQPPAV